MARSLSWIDETELAEQLKRAGVRLEPASASDVEGGEPSLGVDEITRPPLGETATQNLRPSKTASPRPAPRKHAAIAALDEATGPIPEIDDPLPKEPVATGEVTSTDPARPARRPITADFQPPIDDFDFTGASDDAEESPMPGPEDATPLPASFGAGGFGPMAAGAADVDAGADDPSGLGVDDETPVPPGLQAAINTLTQSREAVAANPGSEEAAGNAEEADEAALRDEATEAAATEAAATEDEATEDEATEAVATEDEATEDEAIEDEATEDEAIEDEAPEVEASSDSEAGPLQEEDEEEPFEVAVSEVDLPAREESTAPREENGEGDADVPSSPFGGDGAAGPGQTQPLEARSASGRALARIQLRATARGLPVEGDQWAESADFSRRSIRPGRGGRAPRAGTVAMAAVGGDVIEKAQALIQLLVDKTGSRGAYLADEVGVALASVNITESEVALSVGLREALQPIRLLLDDPEDRAVTLELAGPEHLHVVWVETALGHLAVGLYSSRVLGGDLAPAVRRMLNRLVGELMARKSEPEPEPEPAPEPEPDAQAAETEPVVPEAEPGEQVASELDDDADVTALVERLLAEVDDPDRALRRVALRTGLTIDQIRQSADLEDADRDALGQAAQYLLEEDE